MKHGSQTYVPRDCAVELHIKCQYVLNSSRTSFERMNIVSSCSISIPHPNVVHIVHKCWEILFSENIILFFSFQNKIKSTSISIQWTRFTLLPETIMKDIYGILGIRQWKIVIPEEQKTNVESPTIALAYCRKNIFRLCFKEGKVRWSSVNSLHWIDRTENLRSSSIIEFIRQSAREEKVAQRKNPGII